MDWDINGHFILEEGNTIKGNSMKKKFSKMMLEHLDIHMQTNEP